MPLGWETEGWSPPLAAGAPTQVDVDLAANPTGLHLEGVEVPSSDLATVNTGSLLMMPTLVSASLRKEWLDLRGSGSPALLLASPAVVEVMTGVSAPPSVPYRSGAVSEPFLALASFPAFPVERWASDTAAVLWVPHPSWAL